MMPVLITLQQTLGLRSGETLTSRSCPQTHAAGVLPWLTTRGFHEFCDASFHVGDWQPPLTLLTAIATELAAGGPIAWIGRRCWPTFQCLRRPGEKDPPALRRHLFLDPLSEAERQWGLLEAARCPAVRVVVADGSCMSTTAERRLQLAAETGTAVVLLARPSSECSSPSWAITRWQISPSPSNTSQPRWNVALVRAPGARQDALRQWTYSWTYEVFRGAGTLGISPTMGCGTPAAATRDEAAVSRQSA